MFLWERGTTQMLPLAQAQAINDAGVVVGRVSAGRAAVWQSGTLTVLGTLRSDGSGSSSAVAVGKHGSVIGTMDTDPRGQLPNITHQAAFRWQDGDLEDLGTPVAENQQEWAALLGDDQRVVAWSESDGQAALWDNGVWTRFTGPSGRAVWPTDMNSDGTIVGSDGSRGGGRAFVLADGVAQYFSTDPTSRAEAINERGVVVGRTGQTPASAVAVIWVPETPGNSTP